jgi:hypothetical protein
MSTTKTKRTYEQVMTPKGVLVWPKLKEADEYKGKKHYSAKIRLSGELAAPLIAKIDAAIEKSLPDVQAELKAKLAEATTGKAKAAAKKALEELSEASKPYRAAVDNEGEETGEYEFNFKMPDHFKGKNDEPVYIRPDLFDAKGVKLKKVPDVWGGTVARVAGELRPFYTALAGYGVSLRLKGVQIITLASGGGGRDASSYGFGSEEGYSAEDDDSEGAPTDGTPDNTDEPDSGTPDF